jgi:hypothetical protein
LARRVSFPFEMFSYYRMIVIFRAYLEKIHPLAPVLYYGLSKSAIPWVRSSAVVDKDIDRHPEL